MPELTEMVKQERKSRPPNSFVCKIFPVNPLSARFCGERGGSANHNCKRIMDLEEKSQKNEERRSGSIRSSPSANRFLRFNRLLAHVVGNVGELAFIGEHCVEIADLPDQIERTQSLPNLLARGIDDRDFSADYDIGSGLRNGAAAARNRRTNLDCLSLRVLQLGQQAALMNRGAGPVRVDDFAARRSHHVRRMKQRDDLRTSGGVAEAHPQEPPL